MIESSSDPAAPWHSPQRAWTPLMWIIGAVTAALAAMVLAPLAPVISASATSASATPLTEPNAALAEAAKALAIWAASPPASDSSAEPLARSHAPTNEH
jgi:hypothetical protein